MTQIDKKICAAINRSKKVIQAYKVALFILNVMLCRSLLYAATTALFQSISRQRLYKKPYFEIELAIRNEI